MAADEIPTCAKCNAPHVTRHGGQACAGHRRDGHHCTNAPLAGAAVCRKHGGAAPQVKAAAAKRLHQKAIDGAVSKMLARYEDLIPDGMDPLTGLLEVVSRTWLMMRVYGDLVASLRTDSTAEIEHGETDSGAITTLVTIDEPALVDPNHQGNLGSHPFVGEYRSWTLEHARACKLALDAGVEERQVRLAESQAQDVVTAVQAAIAALDLTPEQNERAPEVIANLLRAIAGEA